MNEFRNFKKLKTLFRAMPCALLPVTTLALASPTLTILVPPRTLDAKLVKEFELKKNITVRVELVSNRSEYETKLRNTPKAWDLVLADERKLVTLNIAKIIKPFPGGIKHVPGKSTTDQWSRYNEEGHLFLPLMANPLGIVWTFDTRKTGAAPPDWSALQTPQENPAWRSRIFLPTDLKFQYLFAAKASAQPLQAADIKAAAPTIEWLTKTRVQARADGSHPEFELLSKNAAAGVVWQSDFVRMRQVVPKVIFSVPPSGTLFERLSLGLVTDSVNDALAAEFAQFLVDHRDALAAFAGLYPLGTPAAGVIADTDHWTLFEDYLLPGRTLDLYLQKIYAQENPTQTEKK